jgi:hypothetical protein
MPIHIYFLSCYVNSPTLNCRSSRVKLAFLMWIWYINNTLLNKYVPSASSRNRGFFMHVRIVRYPNCHSVARNTLSATYTKEGSDCYIVTCSRERPCPFLCSRSFFTPLIVFFTWLLWLFRVPYGACQHIREILVKTHPFQCCQPCQRFV